MLRAGGDPADEESGLMMINRSTRKIVSMTLLAVAVWCFTYRRESFGQSPTRNINGTVTDQHREPLKGAVVQVRNVETNGVASYITGEDGRYSFKRLDGETDYRISAKAHGHRSKAKNLSVFDSNMAKTINLVIRFQ